jgi:hypothetical protein
MANTIKVMVVDNKNRQYEYRTDQYVLSSDAVLHCLDQFVVEAVQSFTNEQELNAYNIIKDQITDINEKISLINDSLRLYNIDKIKRVYYEYTTIYDSFSDEKIIKTFVTDIKTTKETIKIHAKGTGLLKAYVDDGHVYVVTLDDLDDSTLEVPVEGHTCSLALEGTITELDLSNNNISNINFIANESLERLKIYNNKLSDINLSPLKNLRYLHIYSNPVVDNYLIHENAYSKIREVLDTLPNRTNKALGSVILYPWYGLETLIYRADGNHYLTPESKCDFENTPDQNTEKVAAGTLCKYPRRLRFIGNTTDSTQMAYALKATKYGTSSRITAGEYYTDEPLTSVFYNSDDQEDPHRSLKTVINGIEYDDTADQTAEESILYALVEGYSINDPTKNPDKTNWTLRYVTYDRDGIEKEHILTKYNQLRKKLEASTTTTKNWFFGSAIQDTKDYAYCQHYFRESGVQDIWESTQKGFGLTWGIFDNISNCQPDWNHKNIVRYTNYLGNTVAAKIKPEANSTSTLGTPTVTGPLHLFASFDDATSRWTSSGGWGHGDAIISYLTSTGKQQLKYNDVIYTDYLYGLCPNVAVYALDQYSGLRRSLTNFFISEDGYMAVLVDKTQSEYQAKLKAGPQKDDCKYAYRYKINDSLCNVLLTIKNTSGGYSHEECKNVPISNVYLSTGSSSIIKNNTPMSNLVKDLAFKDMFEHCDASSLSFTMQGVSSFRKYLVGRFGERRFMVQSSGNSGDNHPASTDDISGSRSPSAPYTSFEDVENANPNPVRYHGTAFIVGASTKALGGTCFSSNASDVAINHFAFSDYMTGFGNGIKGYLNTGGLLAFKQGTSMSCPNTCGIMMLMMNLYKVINPDYPEEPAYLAGAERTSENLIYTDNLLTGGYGKFSPFLNYVKNNWMLRPYNTMSHHAGLGLPSFKAEPSTLTVSKLNNKLTEELSGLNTLQAGIPIPLLKASTDQKFTIAHELIGAGAGSGAKPAINQRFLWCDSVAVVNEKNDVSKIIGLRPTDNKPHAWYLCDNRPAYGDIVSPFDNENEWNYPKDFDTYQNTYNYYLLSPTIKENPELAAKAGNLTLTRDNCIEDYIKLPSNTSKKFTIQMKIKLTHESLCDLPQEGVVSGAIIHYLAKIGYSVLQIQTKTPNIFDGSSAAQIQYYAKILNSDVMLNTYKLSPGKGLIPSTDYDYYACTPKNYQKLYTNVTDVPSDLDSEEFHVLTLVSDGRDIRIYLDGACIVTEDSSNVIANLEDILIYYKTLSPKSEDYLFDNLAKHLLVYTSVLSDEDIFKNVAYLLSTPEES